jgi:prepilin-type N-terminal cleavage/methylation domain-containing protein
MEVRENTDMRHTRLCSKRATVKQVLGGFAHKIGVYITVHDCSRTKATTQLSAVVGLRNGFAMLEVLVAIMIISLSVIGSLTLNTYLLRTSNNFSQYIQAVNLANSEIESLRNYSTLNTTPGRFAYADIIGLNNTNCAVSAAPYVVNSPNSTCTVAVTSSNNPIYVTVTITVGWTDVTGYVQSVQLISMIGSIDPIAMGQTIGT